jgi:hypothetical protein
VYSCKVCRDGNATAEVLGVLGIIFRWDALADTIVRNTPVDEADRASTRACILGPDGMLLADSSGQALKQTLTLPNQEQLFALKKGYRHIEFNGRPTLVGVARSPGFETYATGWHSVILKGLRVRFTARRLASTPTIPSSRFLFQFFNRLWPVALEQARKRAIGEKFAAGLAARTIVHLVFRVADTLHFRAAGRARLPELPVHGHLRAKRRHLRWKPLTGLGAQALGPLRQGALGGVVQARDFRRLHFCGERNWGQPRRVQDLVGVRVANAVKQPRIRERALQRVIFARERGSEFRSAGSKDFHSATFVRG